MGKKIFLRVNRNFVKCYSNKKRIKALELPLQALHNDVSSVFVAFTEIKLWLFKILDIYALVHYTDPSSAMYVPIGANITSLRNKIEY